MQHTDRATFADVVAHPPATGFEGPEKRLEITFKEDTTQPDGLRVISKEQWQELCTLAKCTIISTTKNECFDSYVLSESSLFVYPFKMMMKTCGTTTLLNAIPKALEFADMLGLQLNHVMYSRKNFVFPQCQVGPHTDWRTEVNELNEYFDGTSYIVGPLNSEHWYVYTADYSTERRVSTNEKTIEIMMHNLDPRAAKQFYNSDEIGDHDKFPGVADLVPGSITDEFNFRPCGYSMNGLYKDAYYTIHVTPEPHCSYASFETNLSLTNYKNLCAHVFSIFKPGTVTLAHYYQEGSEESDYVFDPELPGFNLKHKTVSALEGNLKVIMCNYESEEFGKKKPSPRIPKCVKSAMQSTSF
mmetsp:Transcript_4639/g.6476  ORF Transcript_4639/g.6476 Transcript_4639/m.6476 type:complete len:357 (-) Transcript_4639:184-1254(-)